MKIEIYTNGNSLYDCRDALRIVSEKMNEGYSQWIGKYGSRDIEFWVKDSPIKTMESIDPTKFNAVKSKSVD